MMTEIEERTHNCIKLAVNALERGAIDEAILWLGDAKESAYKFKKERRDAYEQAQFEKQQAMLAATQAPRPAKPAQKRKKK
jgi:hypothetical protein